MFDRRLLENFDWVFLCLVLALASLGVINLFSASAGFSLGGTPIYLKQLYWMLLGLAVMIAILFFDYRFLKEWAYFFYVVGLGMLLLVLILAGPRPGPSAG